MIERKNVKIKGISVKPTRNEKYCILIQYEKETEKNEEIYGEFIEEGVLFRKEIPKNINEFIGRKCEMLRQKDRRTNYKNYILYLGTEENKGEEENEV